MIVACWSGPRNISTALMRSWSSRKDTFVTDEPFYAYYLKETQNNHPMRENIINNYYSNYDEVVDYLIGKVPNQKKIWYQKHMAHHLIDLSKIDWIKKCENCILLRHPKEVINSYTSKNKLNSVTELGYPQQFEIVKFLKKSNHRFKIIDSADLLANPKAVLFDWCESINIKFDQSMLKWEKGSHPNDGIWWKHWYDNVINTSGFQKYQKKDISIENKYDSIYTKSMEYYNYLKGFK
ncbi:MAG: HAD family hydrolase [Candidatus Neomarinimicrobiota bacterium]|nr:HAD family hydrolase [Candidatus Neomarinimicrobiota bacterium]